MNKLLLSLNCKHEEPCDNTPIYNITLFVRMKNKAGGRIAWALLPPGVTVAGDLTQGTAKYLATPPNPPPPSPLFNDETESINLLRKTPLSRIQLSQFQMNQKSCMV